MAAARTHDESSHRIRTGMYASLNWPYSGVLRPNCRPQAAPGQQRHDLISIPTVHGIYFVPRRLEYVQELIRNENIRASCLDQKNHHYHRFLRDLFVLATEESIIECAENTVRDLIADLRPQYRASRLETLV